MQISVCGFTLLFRSLALVYCAYDFLGTTQGSVALCQRPKAPFHGLKVRAAEWIGSLLFG
ncbi:hypothetical protein I6F18_29920 [Bradyrhizobium sp. NBAIM32]|uniref:hypothetical protein n=1 Tax=Bradyrhizobium sp. NBAIM32 TaxID=2793809 RepID=UPI001CD7A655|nr:hypothetical protein [Bradyrhizobium sp. NBAIM32]MCA1544162.1 hypothetical protein [Bradyrhizobium sp. NBAIM32]